MVKNVKNRLLRNQKASGLVCGIEDMGLVKFEKKNDNPGLTLAFLREGQFFFIGKTFKNLLVRY